MTSTRTSDSPGVPVPRNRIGAVEVALCGLMALAIVLTFWRSPRAPSAAGLISDESLFLIRSRQELSPFAAKYGPSHNSRYVEEWLIRDYFQDRRGGIFVDVGANDYRLDSNTYYLETALGWSGLATDALPEFGPDYVTHRLRTRFRVQGSRFNVQGSRFRGFKVQRLVQRFRRSFKVQLAEP